MNVLHVKYSGPAPTAQQLDAYNQLVASAWNTNFASLAHVNTSLTEVITTDLTSNTSAQQTTTVNFPGTRAGEQFTAQVAMVASWNAPLRFRGGHFRTYMPFGVRTDAATVTSWTTAFTAEAAAALNAFRTALNAMSIGSGTSTMIGLSYFTGHALRPAPLPVNISGGAVHGRIDTQRRRLGKEVR
jgi:hypothetical protein